jgi:hypothetical protein
MKPDTFYLNVPETQADGQADRQQTDISDRFSRIVSVGRGHTSPPSHPLHATCVKKGGLYSTLRPNNIKIILEAKVTCRDHRMKSTKTGLGEVWPMAREKEVTPAVQHEILLFSFGV